MPNPHKASGALLRSTASGSRVPDPHRAFQRDVKGYAAATDRNRGRVGSGVAGAGHAILLRPARVAQLDRAAAF